MAGSSNLTSCDRTATASLGPRPISSATSSGQPTIRRSTSGNRSGVANAGRPSTTTVSNPSSAASRTSERATSTPPTMTRRGRTGNTSMNNARPPSVHRPGQAAAEPFRGGGDQCAVKLRISERAAQLAVLGHDQLGIRRGSGPRQQEIRAGAAEQLGGEVLAHAHGVLRQAFAISRVRLRSVRREDFAGSRSRPWLSSARPAIGVRHEPSSLARKARSAVTHRAVA